ncbi:hybrid sensor histidine kinase/response regulator [Noviherbaspirillum agri]
MQTRNWADTPLGPVTGWPPVLRTAAGICLHFRVPTAIWWGPQLIGIYNDTFAAILGDRHPQALGLAAPDAWPEGWHLLEPHIEAARCGESTSQAAVHLRSRRAGQHWEDAYFAVSCSPLLDDSGEVGGVMCTFTDETRHVQTEAAFVETRRKLDAALIAGEVGTFEWNVVTDRLWGDTNFARIFSITLDASGAAPLADYLAAIHPADRDQVMKLVNYTVETGKNYEAEYRIMHGTQVRWVIARGKVEREANGKVVRFPGVVLDVTARRQAEDAVRIAFESAELERRRLAAVLEALPAGVAIADAKGRVTLFNAALVRIWGAHPLPQSIDDYRRWRARWADTGEPLKSDDWAMARALRTGQVVPGDVIEIEKFDTKERVTIINAAAPIRDAQGRIVGGVVTEIDITAQKRAEEALRRTEAELKEAQRIAQIGNWYWDARTDMVTASEELCRIYGIDPETDDIPAFHAQRGHCYSADEWERLNAARQHALRTGEGYTLDFQSLRNGVPIWLTARGEVVRDAAGHIVGMRGTLQDITARKHADEALRQSTLLLQAISDTTGDAFFAKNREGRLTYANPATLALLGKPLDQILGKTDMEFWDDKEAARRLMANDRRVMQQGIAEDFEETVPLSDGTQRTWLSRKVPYLDTEGNVIGLLGVARDITDRKHAEEERSFLLESERIARHEAERANRVKDEFLATLSHELRTPLNAILGWAQIMAMDRGDTKKAADIIERNAWIQVRLIEDLLDMSRIVSGKFELNTTRLHFAEVIANAVESVRHTAEKKGVQLEECLCAEGGMVEGDAARLQQAIWNLLDNAIKFTPAGGQVRISLVEQHGVARFSVADTGEGIDPAFLPHLFDRFCQADASTTRKHGGLGLGLAIVKHITERHGGAVQAKSHGKGSGAIFTMTLPLLGYDGPGRPGNMLPEHTVDEHAFSGSQIVTVDDDVDTNALLKQILEARGASVRAYHSADEALAAVVRQTPDLIISDIGLPGKDGYAFIRDVKAFLGEERSIPAIALTAFARKEDRLEALDAGFSSHLPKPIAAHALLHAVASLLPKSRGRSDPAPEPPGSHMLDC